MVWRQIFLVWISLVSVLCNCNENGTLTFSDISSPLLVPQVQCNGSYIQILIIPDESVPDDASYTLKIEDVKLGRVLVQLTDEKHQGRNLSLASWSNQVNISATLASGVFPFKIHYVDIPQSRKNVNLDATLGVFNSTIEEQVGPNSVVSYRVKVDAQGDNFFDVKWNPKQSATTSFMAVRSSSGRITLITSKLATTFKLAVAENETIALDVVTQNTPGDLLENIFTLNVSAGYEDPTTSTLPPTSTTSKGPRATSRIFLMHVEEDVFVNTGVPLVQEDIMTMGVENYCNFSFSVSSSCREKCHLTDNPSRGCVDFFVTIERETVNLNCLIDDDTELVEKIRGRIPDWKNTFTLDRIEVNECMESVQNAWLVTAVVVTAGAFVLLAAVLILVFHVLPAKKAAAGTSNLHNQNTPFSPLGRSDHSANRKTDFVLKVTSQLNAFNNFHVKHN